MVAKSPLESLWPSLYEPLRAMGTRVADWVAPAAEASATGADYRISVELPGVAEDDVDLTVEDGVMTVRGEKKTSREEKGETWYFSERQFGSFSRSFRLPPDADEAGVKAEMKNGVLVVTVPKRAELAAQPKRVPIATG